MSNPKHTADEIRKILKEKFNGECELVSDYYPGSRKKMEFRCKCGKTFFRLFQDVNRGHIVCRDCYKKSRSEAYRANFEDVKKRIEEHGCQYISGEYVNNQSVLTLRCRCGNVFQKKMRDFFSGQDRCQKCGARLSAQAKIKYTVDDAKRIVAERGYTVIGEYKNSYTPFKCLCSKGHEVDIILSQFMNGCSGCSKCAIEAISGERHWNYHDGRTYLREGLRKAIKPWKRDIIKSYGNKCAVTGETGIKLYVHHLDNFTSLVLKACENVGLDKRIRLGDYSYEEYTQIKDEFIKLHTLLEGVPMKQEIHKRFHRECGIRNNTKEQFNEFLQKYYGISLEQIQEKIRVEN